MDLPAEIAWELAKPLLAEASGVAIDRAKRLVRALRGKLGNAPDLDGLQQQILAAARQDPAWATEIVRLLAEANTAAPVSYCGLPPEPFRDRAGLLEPEPARHWLDAARGLLGRGGDTQYEWELVELEAQLATLAGNAEQARQLWGGLAEAA
ncbi:MAG: hypothetical protein GEU98_05225 [Pseudonocardiaceae bacterium]|nr:hypothetical protein [Pseudonocardiaceae bacterium]